MTHGSPGNSSFLVYTRAAQCPAAGYCQSADCGFELKSRASAGRGLTLDLAAGKWGLNPDLSTDSGREGHEGILLSLCFKSLIRVGVRIYLGGSLPRARGLCDLDLLHLDGVLTVSMRVLQLGHVYCLMLGWR